MMGWMESGQEAELKALGCLCTDPKCLEEEGLGSGTWALSAGTERTPRQFSPTVDPTDGWPLGEGGKSSTFVFSGLTPHTHEEGKPYPGD